MRAAALPADRHFGSKDDLLAEAIEVGSFSLLPGALAPAGFDIDDVVHAMHHGSPSPRTIARILADPRLASAAAASLVVGSAIWGEGSRGAFGLDAADGVESAMADLSRWLVGAPSASTGALPK